ncbi:hypothetical protein PG997_005292 [Apiospora hydei]|uniref:Uncharacterized protein n=1 Tax=Apiospora hydei TaxID=1337664 RepID=A0ABR1X4I9_9PEZI
MVTRHATLACGRHLARHHHHEYLGLHSSLSFIVKQKRGFRSSRALAFSSSPQAHSHNASAAAALLDIKSLRAEMLARPEQLTWDTMSPTPSYLLDISLSEYLDGNSKTNNKNSGNGSGSNILTGGGGLDPKTIKYPLPPGAPFERRMWAGGSIEFRWPLRLDHGPAVCAERIQDVTVRGPPGHEKAFVDVLRCYGNTGRDAKTGRVVMSRAPEGAVREVRTLVFMRKQEEAENEEDLESIPRGLLRRGIRSNRPERLIKVPYKPTYSQTLTPDRTLLFHFSALSYNAHLIHLDERYSQRVERRPGLLVHGPLCLNLMLAVLRCSWAATTTPPTLPQKEAVDDAFLKDALFDIKSPNDITPEDLERIVKRSQLRAERPSRWPPAVWRIDYRNLAPLYVDEEMRVCVRSQKGSHKHDVWIENHLGGLCVKGTVLTTESAEAKSALFRM